MESRLGSKTAGFLVPVFLLMCFFGNSAVAQTFNYDFASMSSGTYISFPMGNAGPELEIDIGPCQTVLGCGNFAGVNLAGTFAIFDVPGPGTPTPFTVTFTVQLVYTDIYLQGLGPGGEVAFSFGASLVGLGQCITLSGPPLINDSGQYSIVASSSMPSPQSVTVQCQNVTLISGVQVGDGFGYISNLTIQFGNPNHSLSVASAHFEQVVQDPRINQAASGPVDAVAGKSASFQVQLTGAAAANPTDQIVVQIKNSAGTVLAQTANLPMSSISSTGLITPNMFLAPNSKPYVPKLSDSGQLTVHIATSATDLTTTDYTGLSLNVHQVTAPTIGFVQVNSPFSPTSCVASPGTPVPNLLGISCYLSPASGDVLADLKSDKFMSAVYPVPDNSYAYSLNVTPQITGVPGLPNDKLIWQDYNQLELMRAMGGFSRMVGIVSAAYLPTRINAGANDFAGTGLAPLYIRNAQGQLIDGQPKSVFVVAGSPESVSHEIGHTFGLTDLYTTTSGPAVYSGSSVQGYDATQGLSYLFPSVLSLGLPAISFMGPANYNGGLLSGPNAYNNYWADNVSYDSILSIVSNPLAPDPVTIFVSGILEENGQFTFGPSVNLPNGIVTPTNTPGDVSVALLDNGGKILNQIALQSNFQAQVDYAGGAPAGPMIVDTGAMPIDVQLPFSSAATQIQVSKNNIVLKKISISGQVLAGIVSRIPLSAFSEPRECKHVDIHKKRLMDFCANFPTIDQSLLNDTVAVAQKEINSSRPESALITLGILILEIQRLTSDSYSVANSLELTQPEVISQIKGIMSSLESAPKAKPCK
jgi:hypothetical protein